MEIKLHGHNLEITNSIRNYVEKKLDVLARHFPHFKNMSAYAKIDVKHFQQIFSVTIQTPHSSLHAEESEPDLYASIDLAVDKIDRQMRKIKTKKKNRTRQSSLKSIHAAEFENSIASFDDLENNTEEEEE